MLKLPIPPTIRRTPRLQFSRIFKSGGIMKRLFSAAALLCFATSLIVAKPAKTPSLPPGDIFFTMKGQPFALERTFPGIMAAFMFTDDQRMALNEEYQETVADPQLREKGASL